MRTALLPVPELLRRWLGPDPQAGAILYGGAVLLLSLLLLWLRFGYGPRRRYTYRRVLRSLQHKQWQPALEAARRLCGLGRLSPLWEGRAGDAEGQAHRLAGDAALQEKRYEDSLEHYLTAARLLRLERDDARERVVGHMLAEVRRLFAAGNGTEAVHALIGRVLQMAESCPEASFWRGLCFV